VITLSIFLLLMLLDTTQKRISAELWPLVLI
jgi:hypothetical protein